MNRLLGRAAQTRMVTLKGENGVHPPTGASTPKPAALQDVPETSLVSPDFVTAAASSCEAPSTNKETAPSASPQPSCSRWLWPPLPGLPPSLNYTTAQIDRS